MKEPERNSYFFAGHTNSRFTPDHTPSPATSLKNSHATAANFVMPQANNALPLSGAVEHNPPKANERVGSLAAVNRQEQSRREVLEAESEGVRRNLTIYGQCNLTTLLKETKTFNE